MPDGERIPLAGLWGEIQSAVRQRVTTAELWRMANAAAQARGFAGVSGGLPEMNRLRGTASAIFEGARRFNRARPEQQIGPEMFAPDINAKSIEGRSITPVYRVRFLQEVRTALGETVATHRTISFPVQLPSTKQLLLAELQADAAVLAETYGETDLGISEIEISVV